MEIRLTPTGQLRWEVSEEEAESVAARNHSAPTLGSSLRKAFEADWREGLFTLAAEKIATDDSSMLQVWRPQLNRHAGQTFMEHSRNG